MATFITTQKHGYSCKFSPFYSNTIAAIANNNYGLSGKGTLYILEWDLSNNIIHEKQKIDWHTNLYGLVWSELDSNICVTSSDTGVLQVWDISKNCLVIALKEHSAEVYSLDWSKSRNDPKLLSASWDGSIKIWDIIKGCSISNIKDDALIHCSIWSPHWHNVLANTSSDGTVKVWELNNNITNLKAHDGEALCLDFCKYDSNILATSGSDGFIRIWDLRNSKQPLQQLINGSNPCRQLMFSPYSNNIIASVGYGFTTNIFDIEKSSHPIEIINNHTEYVYGLDWSNFHKNYIVDCGWDSLIKIFKPESLL